MIYDIYIIYLCAHIVVLVPAHEDQRPCGPRAVVAAALAVAVAAQVTVLAGGSW